MDERLIEMFTYEVACQCDTGLRGSERAQAALDKQRPWDSHLFWDGMQLFVGCAAMTSKLLFGNKKTYPSRHPLRDSLGVEDTSPLRLRDIRDSMEHVDERLEALYRSDPTHPFVTRNVVARTNLTSAAFDATATIDPDRVFQNYDPDTMMLMFMGSSLDVAAVGGELARILARCREVLGVSPTYDF